jgi:hypothetical protein
LSKSAELSLLALTLCHVPVIAFPEVLQVKNVARVLSMSTQDVGRLGAPAGDAADCTLALETATVADAAADTDGFAALDDEDVDAQLGHSNASVPHATTRTTAMFDRTMQPFHRHRPHDQR